MNEFILGTYNNDIPLSILNGKQDILYKINNIIQIESANKIKNKWKEYKTKKEAARYLIRYFPRNMEGMINVMHPKTAIIIRYINKIIRRYDKDWTFWFIVSESIVISLIEYQLEKDKIYDKTEYEYVNMVNKL